MPNTKKRTSQLETSQTDAIIRKLDAIISLLVEWQPDEDSIRKVEDQTIRLAKVGLRPVEIAAITGRAPNNVSKNITQARRDGRLPRSTRRR
jgi:hypothetical protein